MSLEDLERGEGGVGKHRMEFASESVEDGKLKLVFATP